MIAIHLVTSFTKHTDCEPRFYCADYHFVRSYKAKKNGYVIL